MSNVAVLTKNAKKPQFDLITTLLSTSGLLVNSTIYRLYKETGKTGKWHEISYSDRRKLTLLR